eukprot:6483193-Amphidinium_carterae.1
MPYPCCPNHAGELTPWEPKVNFSRVLRGVCSLVWVAFESIGEAKNPGPLPAARLPAIEIDPFSLEEIGTLNLAEELPIDPVHGGTIQRLVSDELANLLVLSAVSRTEGVTDYKPGCGKAIQLPIALGKVSQGFLGQPDYEEPPVLDSMELANRYLEAKASAWAQALYSGGGRGKVLAAVVLCR